jgi:hypothetical protein
VDSLFRLPPTEPRFFPEQYARAGHGRSSINLHGLNLTPNSRVVALDEQIVTFLVSLFFWLQHIILIYQRGGFIGMALLCQFEVIVITFTTFKRFSGLYFWSIVYAAIGAFLVTFGVAMSFFDLRSTMPGTVVTNVGYFVYIPAEFAMIYSR